jgi:hypothetical protein
VADDRPTSDPPELKASDQKLGKRVRLAWARLERWVYYTRQGTRWALLAAGAIGWLIRHVQHLRGTLP